MEMENQKIEVRDIWDGDWYWIPRVVFEEYTPKIGVIGLALYNAYASYARDKGIAFPSQETLAEKRAAGATENPKLSELLFSFAWWMKKQGYSDQSIATYIKILRTLAKRGANLYDSESIKEAIAKQQWASKRKATAVNAYSCLLMMIGGKWDPPVYKNVKKIPFIPTEQEIDQLIAGCGPKTAAFLQLLKETGMRAG
jgi:integrase